MIQIYEQFGKHCVIHRVEDGKVLKIFNAYPLDDWSGLDDFRWGDLPKREGAPNKSCGLIDATKIQNICAYHGLAPRVYGIVKVMVGYQKHWAQLVEDAGKGETEIGEAVEIYEKIKELGGEYGFKNEKDDCNKKDVIKGKLVDFNTFQLTGAYKNIIKAKYIEYAKYGKIYYHNVPEFGLNGSPRENENRVKWAKLNDIDFKGKDVLDLGCAGGFFARYAKDRGAKNVMGIDQGGHGSGNPIMAAKLLSNELGYWEVEFKEMNIEKEKPSLSDIVFFMSMNYHVGIPEWLAEVTKEICVFEDNSKKRDVDKTLKEIFKEVKMVGRSKEHGNKPIYWCVK